MKSERPENDEDAAAGATGEPAGPQDTAEPPRTSGTARPAQDPTAPDAPPAEAAAPDATADDDTGAPGPADGSEQAADAAPAPSPGKAPAPDDASAQDAAHDDAADDDTGTPEPADDAEQAAADAAAAPSPGKAAAPDDASAQDAAHDDAEVAALSGGGEEPGDESGRPVRRRSPLVVASVAVAVLLAGGGGAYVAASGGSGGGSREGAGASGGSAPPPLALDGYSSGVNGIAPGEPDPYGTTYRADGRLPDGPGSAAVYRPAGEVPKDRVAALAKALGVEGAPVAEGPVWKVGTDHDGSGGSLQVNRDAPGIWTYSRYAPGTDTCKAGPVCGRDPGAPAPAPVSVAAAEKAAAPVLKALGQDGAKLDASQVMGAQRAVNADPVVGGLPTHGWTTGLTVGGKGEVVGGNGMLATPVEGDTYPVLSAARTLRLMNAAPRSDHRMGIGGCASSVPLKDRLEQPCSASSPSASSAVVDGAVFGLAAHSVGGRQALVPSWLFRVRGAADSYTVTYPAVDPAYLASAASPTPSSSPGAPKDVKVDGYTADGRDLTVAFTGGVCADYAVTADESAGQVAVKVTATPWPDKICVMIAKQYHKTVRLDAPLDGRKVVGAAGRAVPPEKATPLDPQVG
ncbi:hypothetical protein [Streptomyces gramineus]|uniref:hypothetical protein n=1 Tax=Streptomyces gramineus TaxID=910542 RepID=UPI00398B96BA